MKTSPFKEKIEESLRNFWNVRDEYKTKSIEELREITDKSSREFDICILNLTGDLNVGMIIRTAHLMGVRKVWVFGRRKYDNRSLVGCHNYTNIINIFGLDDTGELDDFAFRSLLKDELLIPIYVEHGGTPLHEIDWKCPMFSTQFNSEIYGGTPCFVFGNEGEGIPNIFMSDPNELRISIPQVGVIRSYNVAAAASIVMWEFVRSTLNQNRPLDKSPPL